LPPLGVVDAIARPDVDLQFRYAISQISVLARVAVNQAIDPHENTCSPGAVSEFVDPLTVFVGLLNAHLPSVAQRLQLSRAVQDSAHCGLTFDLSGVP